MPARCPNLVAGEQRKIHRLPGLPESPKKSVAFLTADDYQIFPAFGTFFAEDSDKIRTNHNSSLNNSNYPPYSSILRRISYFSPRRVVAFSALNNRFRNYGARDSLQHRGCAKLKKAAVPSILIAVVLLAVAVTAEAQQPKKVPRIGSLD